MAGFWHTQEHGVPIQLRRTKRQGNNVNKLKTNIAKSESQRDKKFMEVEGTYRSTNEENASVSPSHMDILLEAEGGKGPGSVPPTEVWVELSKKGLFERGQQGNYFLLPRLQLK